MAVPMENVLSALIPIYFEDSSSLEHVPNIIGFTDDHQLFSLQKTSSLHPVISHVHNCLNSSNKRLEGLLLLETLVKQSSTLVFTDNIYTWIKLLLQILKSPGETTFHQQSCKILSMIIKSSTSFSEISREISTNIIPQLLPVLLYSQPLFREEAISCIKVCAESYPGPTGSFRSKIEKILLIDLQSEVPKTDSPSCLAILGICGGGGKNRIKHTEGWSIQFTKIYSTLNNTISMLYQPLNTDEQYKESNDGFQLNILPETLSERNHILLHRLSIFTQVLSSLLTEDMTAVAKVPVEDILRFICQCLEVKGNILLRRPTTDNLVLLSILPTIHRTSLTLLHNLIVSCGNILIPFSSTINKLLIESLVWTNNKTQYGQQKRYSTLRNEVYQTMCIWLKKLGAACNIVEEEKDLIRELIHDITPPIDVIKLSSTGVHNGFEPPKKKKKNMGYQDLTQSMSSYRKIDTSANSDLTSTCLKALQLFVFYFGSSLKSKSYKDIGETVISIILDIQCSHDNLPIPYHDVLCRKRLYGVLKSCIMSPHSNTPSLLQCAVKIFAVGQRDMSIKVSTFCKECSAICECLYHPRAPCIMGPNIATSTLNFDRQVQQNTEDSSSTDVTPFIKVDKQQSVKRLSLSRSQIERTSLGPVEEQVVMMETVVKESIIEGNLESDNDDNNDDDDEEDLEELEVDPADDMKSSLSLPTEIQLNSSTVVIETETTVKTQSSEEKKDSLKSATISTSQQGIFCLVYFKSKDVDDMVMCFVDADPDEKE
ncbi:hypothetical protein LOTGIDRAFT_232958 [Lottia gigantea]|uniref:Pre-rRNA-processing protein RIX1 N-terminal domain-containing protein n=1 Tax=Lottia gigantea TaxID=225164 RepID=V4BV59_LOTGI|nr:hypothetical protein LOTGIDRAFT_232958 [Lottia gigantea]ESO92884.1 hypothetical protein LOTGIDRAFT_232958 [Lottia gigantea]